MQTKSSGLTDVGRRRSVNQDALFIDDELGLFIVADGMGGHAGGEIASQEAVDSVHGMMLRERDTLERLRTSPGRPSAELVRSAIRALESAVQAATYMVYSLAEHEPSQQGMGTTVSALQVCGDYGIVAQVGDSRVYLVRDGIASPLTEDHTLVAWQLKQGIITEQEAALSPHRNVITRAVGSREYVQVDTHFFDVHAGDFFLLCSDGLHGYVEAEEIPAIIDLGPATAAKRFVQIANERGGRDNITAVVVSVR